MAGTLVHGKIWEAGKDEPKDWTLEVEDPIGNQEGAPALYAFATGITAQKPGTETFFRNVTVTPNKKRSGKEAPKEQGSVKPAPACQGA